MGRAPSHGEASRNRRRRRRSLGERRGRGRSTRDTSPTSSRRFPSSSTRRWRPPRIKAIVRLAKSGVEHVVFSRFDDEPGKFLELIEGIPAFALGDRMLQELAGPLFVFASCSCTSGRPVISVARAVQELSRSRRGGGDEPPHALSESRTGRDLLGESAGGVGTAASCLRVSAGSWTVDQGRGGQSRISLRRGSSHNRCAR